MNISDTLKLPFRKADANGAGPDHASEGLPPALLAAAVPLVILAVAGGLRLQRRQPGTAVEKISHAAGKATSGHHKPKNRARYYAIGLLIAALERDRTRKAVILGLKYAQKRA